MEKYYSKDGNSLGRLNIKGYVADKFNQLVSFTQPVGTDNKTIVEKDLNEILSVFNLKLIMSNDEHISIKLKKKPGAIDSFYRVYENSVFVLIITKYIRRIDNYIFFQDFETYHPISSKEEVNKFLKFYTSKLIKHKELKSKPTVFFISKDNSGLRLKRVTIQKKEVIDFSLNYNDDFDYKKIESDIKQKKNGLILLGGKPGTGKSTFIRWLSVREKERAIVFIPSYMLNCLESPEFMHFTLDSLKDSILVIEDAEKILLDRSKNGSSAISTILNITSGTLGLVTNITIICTYNTSEKLDNALFRKGRLLYEYNFGSLNIDKANKLSEKLGHNIRYLHEPTLAEVMNIEDTNHKEVKESNFGFNIKQTK